MILIDYIYYFFCNLYRLSRKQRRLEIWKISGGLVSGFSLALFCLGIMHLIDFHLDYRTLNIYTVGGLPISGYLFFAVRYRKYDSYEDASVRLKSLSSTKQTVLNISLILYFLFLLFFFIHFMTFGNIRERIIGL